jgi:acyl-CoA synthetase (AMP-forming)/AMP-acid ligase II
MNMNTQILNEIILKNKVTFAGIAPYFGHELLKDKNVLPMARVRNCMVGGERFDQELLNSLQRIFPNAFISAAYGSTEVDIITYGYFEQKGTGHLCRNVELKVN